jgi:D-alanyl-D-alanine carboxypeptidase
MMTAPAVTPTLLALAEELGIPLAELAVRGLMPCTEPDALVLAETGEDGREHRLTPAAATAWWQMKAAAREDGIALWIVSAFRSIARQADLVRAKLAAGITIEAALTVCAPPGFSEHHTGRAVDLATIGCRRLEVDFELTPAFAWLTTHASEFGFRLSYPVGNESGYQYEPWHWCFDDPQTSGTMTT